MRSAAEVTAGAHGHERVLMMRRRIMKWQAHRNKEEESAVFNEMDNDRTMKGGLCQPSARVARAIASPWRQT